MAGQINRDWYDNVSSNLEGQDRTVADLFSAVTNYACEIDSELSVSCDGKWLDQARIDEIVLAIEQGA